jgi:LacI family transcriptional regulator
MLPLTAIGRNSLPQSRPYGEVVPRRPKQRCYFRKAGRVTTMAEVAALAGVSISTVSHVVNGTRHVEPETRMRVEEAIRGSAYRQDALARALRRSQTDSIGLVVSDAGEPAFAEMVHGVEKAASKVGLTLLLANSAESSQRELDAVGALLDRRVDGLILARAADSSPEVIELLLQEKSPVVLLDRVFGDLHFDQIGAENVEPMRELVRHLAALGHKRIAVVAGDTRVPTLRERLEGFRQEVEASGLDPSSQIEIVGPNQGNEIPNEITTSLHAPTPPTAYIACSTVLAAQVLGVFKDGGIVPGRDVAFATFDGFSHADLFEPRLTTVRQRAFEVGVTAVELLRQRMTHSSAAPRIVRLPQTIEYRDSTEFSVLSGR